MLEEEALEAEREKEKYMQENCPNLSIPNCMQELQVNLMKFTLSFSGHLTEKVKATFSILWFVLIFAPPTEEAAPSLSLSVQFSHVLWHLPPVSGFRHKNTWTEKIHH